VTVYLLDENVLRELTPSGHVLVRAWVATVSDADLRISVLTLFEKRRGAERLRKTDPDRAQTLLAALDRLEEIYAERIIPINAAVAANVLSDGAIAYADAAQTTPIDQSN